MKKRILCLALSVAIILSFAAFTVSAEEDVYAKVYGVTNYVNVIIDGQVVNTPDFVIDGTTYLGLRALAEALGYTVEWDQESKVAMLASGGQVNLGSEVIEKGLTEELQEMYVLYDYVNAIFIDGEPVRIKNIVRDGRTYLGLRDMGELLDYEVSWDGDTNTATLTKIVPVSTNVELKGSNDKYDDLATVYFKFYAVNYPDEKEAAIVNQVKNDILLYDYFKDTAAKNNISYDLGDTSSKYKAYQQSYGTEQEYKDVLKLFNLTEEEDYLFFISNTEMNTVQPLVVNHLYENLESIKSLKDKAKPVYEEKKASLAEDVSQVKHILIPSVDLATGEKLSEEGVKEAKELANSILSKARKSSNKFDELVKQYNKDDGQPEEGYKVTIESQFVPEFESAALSLKKGEISGVVETTYGFHILKCIDKYTYTPTFEEFFVSEYEDDYSALMQAEFEAWAKDKTIEYTVLPLE